MGPPLRFCPGVDYLTLPNLVLAFKRGGLGSGLDRKPGQPSQLRTLPPTLKGAGAWGRTQVPGARLSAQRRGTQTHRQAGGRVGGGLVPIRAICLWYQASGAAGWLTGMALTPGKELCLEIALIASNFPAPGRRPEGSLMQGGSRGSPRWDISPD